MNNKPRISILTPVLNAAEFIEGCIQNVREQDVPDAEHLVIDGGSQDGTVEIIKRAENDFPNTVRLISAHGTTQSEAMNLGINEAQAALLGILNADDYYEAGVFKRALELTIQLPQPIFISGNCNVLNEAGSITHLNKPSLLSPSDLLAGRPYPWNPSAYFYHKSLHDLAGLYDEEDPLTMDIDFILRAMPYCTSHYVDETWGNFRYISGAKTFEQGGGIQARVDALRKKYLEQADAKTQVAAKAKILQDKLKHKVTRRFMHKQSVSNA